MFGIYYYFSAQGVYFCMFVGGMHRKPYEELYFYVWDYVFKGNSMYDQNLSPHFCK